LQSSRQKFVKPGVLDSPRVAAVFKGSCKRSQAFFLVQIAFFTPDENGWENRARKTQGEPFYSLELLAAACVLSSWSGAPSILLGMPELAFLQPK
jgi:hypothetical protein